MMTRFTEYCGERFRVLSEDEGGAWIISFDAPAPPLYVTDSLERIETPPEFRCHGQKPQTEAAQRKVDMIAPLVEDEACIQDRDHRRCVANQIAEENSTTRKRVLRLYYRFLATGSVSASAQKVKEMESNPEYNWAIRTFYFSARRMSLRMAYEMLLLRKYTDASGQLMEPYPSWGSFRHYYYRANFHKQPQKTISRQGLSYYQRNERPAFGSAQDWKQCGAYEVDAQEADIYLVSHMDRSQVIGRPNIYLAADVRTEMITGLYVSMQGGEEAVMRLVANSALDKVAFSKKFGIEIDSDAWPVSGMPTEIISDKGSDFCSHRVEELCLRYGVQLESVPPYRSEQKPLVERCFGLLNDLYKPLLRGKGVIEEDAQERWATDYRSQAILTLDEFVRVLIHCILNLNSRVLPCGSTPMQLWLESSREARLLPVEDYDLYLMSLPRESTKCKLSRTGFRFHQLNYAPEDMDLLHIGDAYQIAWDADDCSRIYAVLGDGQYVRCVLVKNSLRYSGLSAAEVEAARLAVRNSVAITKQAELGSKVGMLHSIKEIISNAEEERRHE
jgi:transposase InsO family protein